MYTISTALDSSLSVFSSILLLDKKDDKSDAFDSAARVRARLYFDLIEIHNYPPSRIEFDVMVFNFPSSRVADVVVYQDSAHNKPFLVAECREEWMRTEVFDKVCSKAQENAKAMNAKYAMCVAGSRVHIFYVADGSSVSNVPEWEGAM